ncbi:MAG: NAD-dependent epimerase/dehydratase family protein [Hyphomonadaceae bacterium]
MSRVLLTGASGYLGGLIARKFTASGWDVVGMTRRPKAGEVAFTLGDDVAPPSLAGADALVHCAYDFAPIAFADIKAINVEGSARLFRAAREAGVRNVVLISTISAFDGCKSNYGRAKLLIEAEARAAAAAIIRPGLIYGSSPGAMFGRLVSQVRAASIVPMPGDGRQMMYTVHEDDLTNAIFRAATRSPAPTAPVTVANETPIAFADIMRAIGARLGRRVTPAPIPWQAMWLGLRGAELLRVPIGLRSDSLVSLINQDTAPLLNAEAELGVRCRPFGLSAIAL